MKSTARKKKNDPAYALAFVMQHSLSEPDKDAIRGPLQSKKPFSTIVRFLSAWTHKYGQLNSTKAYYVWGPNIVFLAID